MIGGAPASEPTPVSTDRAPKRIGFEDRAGGRS